MSAALQRITGCSLTRFFTDIEREFPGVICRRVSATGGSCTSALADGQRAAFSTVFSSCWRAIPTTNYMMIDATIVSRSSAQRRRAKKNGSQAIGRSRGGLTTKIRALVDALGNPVELMLTPGQAHDLACAEPLLENADPDALIADKAYDADPFVDILTQRAITPVIPPKANRKIQRACDFALYCERNIVERFFNQLKHFRAIATRYDKLARNFLAGVQLAAITILLN